LTLQGSQVQTLLRPPFKNPAVQMERRGFLFSHRPGGIKLLLFFKRLSSHVHDKTTQKNPVIVR